MQKKSVLIFAFVLLLFCAPLANASAFNWITGQVTDSITEEVKCVFLNSNTEQKCYTTDGKYTCSGIENCIISVSEPSGTQFVWVSKCEGTLTSTSDGISDDLFFKCETPAATPTPVITPESNVNEQVKCIFANSDSMQKCYTSDGRFGCSGVGTCIADIYGATGTPLTWKSECGGYAYTKIDNVDEYAKFDCGATTQTTTQLTPAELVKESVKCIFINSEKEQECYSSDGFKCAGEGSCVVNVENHRGKQLDWKSSCGGNAYTVMDGNNEYAEFKCTQITSEQPQPIPIPPAAPTLKKATIYAFLQEKCDYCDKLKDFAAQLHQKYSNVEFNYYTVTPSSEQAYTIIVSAYIKKGVPAIFLNNKVWNGFNDNIAAEIENEAKLCIEKGCPINPNPPIPEELKYYLNEVKSYTAPRLATLQSTAEGKAKEQVRCIFKNSDVLINPHTAKHEKCLTEDGTFGCEWSGEVEVLADGTKKAYCVVMDVYGAAGKKMTWKSSCGGYAYSVIDSSNEDVEFSCIPSTNVTTEQISGRGFAYARWQCYDGTGGGAVTAECKISEVWQSEAESFCKERCYSDGSKCGVNSFAVSRDCYIEAGGQGVVFMPIPAGATEKIEETKMKEALMCKDSCPLDNKCYPYGYRKASQYCSDEGIFAEQNKKEEACDNNFECSSNLCLAGKCVSEGFINKIINWLKRLINLEGLTKKNTEIIDCGASSECMENAFKECKPAKISQSGSASEIIGLKGGKCILKITAGSESMTCKIENYKLGTKNLGDMSQYCEGSLVKKLSSFTTASKVQSPSDEKTISKEVKAPTQTQMLRPVETQIPAEPACEKIKSPNLKHLCNAMIKKDPSDCEMLDESAAPYCYADVALAAKNSAICEKIKDSSHEKACKALVERAKDKCSEWIYADYCYRDVAALTGNTDACDYIKYEGGKIECRAVVLNDAALCENSDNQDCYQKVALLTGDEKACDELQKRENERAGSGKTIYNLDKEVSRCIMMAKKEMTGCSTTLSNSGIDCDLIPVMAKDASLCENLKASYPGDVGNKDRCYFYSAISLADLMSPQLILLRN